MSAKQARRNLLAAVCRSAPAHVFAAAAAAPCQSRHRAPHPHTRTRTRAPRPPPPASAREPRLASRARLQRPVTAPPGPSPPQAPRGDGRGARRRHGGADGPGTVERVEEAAEHLDLVVARNAVDRAEIGRRREGRIPVGLARVGLSWPQPAMEWQSSESLPEQQSDPICGASRGTLCARATPMRWATTHRHGPETPSTPHVMLTLTLATCRASVTRTCGRKTGPGELDHLCGCILAIKDF